MSDTKTRGAPMTATSRRDPQRGATLVEYALIVAFCALVTVVAICALQTVARKAYMSQCEPNSPPHVCVLK